MRQNGYKVLGFLVWQGGKWYLRRNYRQRLPSRRVAGVAAVATVLAIAAAVLLSGRRDDD